MNEATRTSGPMVAIRADEMKRRRQINGLSQTALAELAGVDNSHISHIESGRRPTISPAVFARICDALGVHDRAELMAS